MTKEDKYFDDLFREKLAGFEEKPPAHVWANIRHAQGAARKKRLFFYLRLTGAAAAILIAFFVGQQVFFYSDTDIIRESIVETTPLEPKAQQETEIASNTDSDLVDPVKEEPAVTKEKTPTFFAQAELPENNTIDEHARADKIDKEKESDKQETYPLLESIQRNFFPFSTENENLKKIHKREKPQVLTAEDLAIIENNRKLFAQNNQESVKEQWQIGAMVTPNLSVNQTNHKTSYASNMSVPGSKENISVGGGLSVSFKASKRWSIQSGVYYSQLGQSSSNQINRIVQNPDREFVTLDNSGAEYFNTSVEVKSNSMLLNATAGVVEIENLPSNAKIGNGLESAMSNEGILLTAAEFQQNFEYVEVPLNIRYQVIDSKIDLNLLGGFSSNFLIGNNAYLENNLGRERIGETKDMNSITYSTTFGFGIGYELSNKLSFNLEPQVKYFLGSLNNNSQLSFKPYTIGVYTGLSYRF